ncbi:hypothetical protein K437DRAFT_254256 [Tilletiaria anomala UBC 951]|uniref:Uncharacterized protein n=1 Tax=Tilletiaria anomala (strain ATCC 24038 / CBS 436.72 / UBC 951) TaxID=1037660 RepID=A0A066WNA9_TILAU|nr:uncharacterized protein K437DRAFT_254256 [Tilletiaria anomala UBC 951]KDN52474.1 hypothetical protein K437DRAFT_254256 [Tilletiaria anomala UBC 951]
MLLLDILHLTCSLGARPVPASLLACFPLHFKRSGASSNLTLRLNTPAHHSVAQFVTQGPQGAKYTLDGARGTSHAKLCRIGPGAGAAHPAGGGHGQTGQMDCVDIALEAKDLFATMQQLNFFCQLPQDPSKTHIICEKIPQ